MARIKLKTRNKTKDGQDKLLQILANHDVYATSIVEARDGLTITLHRNEEVDTVFTPESLTTLTNNGFQAVLPPDIKAKRTVLLFGCPNEITRHSEEELENEIQRVNSYTEDMIEEIYKFPNRPIIKVLFKQAHIAQKAQETGIKMFNMSIPPHSIQEEEFIPIATCMRCYALNNHYTAQCTKDRTYKVCSECGEEGHKFNECTSTTKKCLNCSGPHRTLSYQCATRKEIIKQKKEENKTKSQNTYSTITTSNSMQIISSTGNMNFNNDAALKTLNCILHAHVANIQTPGTYQEALNMMLTANDLPQVKVPFTPDSEKIINLPSTPSQQNPTAENPQAPVLASPTSASATTQTYQPTPPTTTPPPPIRQAPKLSTRPKHGYVINPATQKEDAPVVDTDEDSGETETDGDTEVDVTEITEEDTQSNTTEGTQPPSNNSSPTTNSAASNTSSPQRTTPLSKRLRKHKKKRNNSQ